jgi:hypothetical protein
MTDVNRDSSFDISHVTGSSIHRDFFLAAVDKHAPLYHFYAVVCVWMWNVSARRIHQLSSLTIRRPCRGHMCSRWPFFLPPGSGESGKSTIVKQMKIIHQNGYTRDELLSFRPLIWKNLLESARDVILALTKFNLEPITPANKVHLVFDLLCPVVLPRSVFHRQIANVS